jgi:hypothetical protein
MRHLLAGHFSFIPAYARHFVVTFPFLPWSAAMWLRAGALPLLAIRLNSLCCFFALPCMLTVGQHADPQRSQPLA